MTKITAEEILAGIDEKEHWRRFLAHEDPKIALQATIYLTNRRDGLPKQAVEMDDKHTTILLYGPTEPAHSQGNAPV